MDREEVQISMRAAAELLRSDYLNDHELTIFTLLDSEEFYEEEPIDPNDRVESSQ